MTMVKQMKAEVGVNGRILVLQTAVKGGIFSHKMTQNFNIYSPTAAYGGEHCGEGEYNVELRRMIEEMNSIEIPSVFICPISLEPKLEPATPCTGQTYEKSNISKWLSLGHKTCPTTIQELWDESVTPNTTLYQLIYSWFLQKYIIIKKRSEDVHGRVIKILSSLKTIKGQTRIDALREVKEVVIAHNSAKNAMLENHGVDGVSALLGPFTTHVVGAEVLLVIQSGYNCDINSLS